MDFKKNPLFVNLLSLNLPTADYAIFGSGPMFPRGLREEIHDLDIVARGAAWEKVRKLSEPELPHNGQGEVVILFDGEIEIFNQWTSGDWNIEELIDTADEIDGIRFVTLEKVLKWKGEMGRSKDIIDIQKIEEYLTKSKN